ncbi:unnamed protein product [Paramecium sonneborni]|uniref:Oxysterol-binding protein n=1 Tax=Paramecium sonneborni TaxID=65129 RepID=A0A8S1N319_9CILI|nr:unnamed protein product [Paramecium sonneborni]
MFQANHVIYELEDDEENIQQTSKQQIKINRKLGAVSYKKWGKLYNYYFSFNLKKARILCYKKNTSSSYNNYYSLNKGDFVKDESEINRFESNLKKKKNYQYVSDQKLIIYVRTSKGRIFKLVIDENENYDKIVGYLQICFSSKIQTVNSFFALLGVGLIKLDDCEFKLTTGIFVSLNDWSQNNNNKYLLMNHDQGLNLLISNIELLGGIIGSFYKTQNLLGIIFNPFNQTIDIVLFDNLNPQILLQGVFKLVKFNRKQIQPSGRGQLLKLKTDMNEIKENHYVEIAQNENVKIYINNAHLNISDYELVQGSMFSSQYIDDQNDLDADKLISNTTLEFYKNQYKISKNNEDETKEFIIVNKQQKNNFNNFTSPRCNKRQLSIITEEINDENYGQGVQVAKSIKIHIHRSDQNINQFPNITPPKLEFITEFKTGCFNNIESIDQVKQNLFQQEEKQLNNKEQQKVGQQLNKEIEQQKCQVQEQEQEQEQDNDSDEIDLVKFSIVFEASEHSPYRDYNSIMNYAVNFKKIDYKDEYRVSIAHKSGGTACQDKKIIELARSVGKNMIKQVGQKLLSGNFNLTQVSFPIRAMIPKSALEKTFMQTILFPLYMNKAASIQDPLERIKLSIIGLLSNYIQANSFLKPLNPILGETFEGGYEDGTQLFCEQISHHPPLSYFLVFGPKKSYKFYGYSLYEAKAGFNSLTILNHGKRTLQFNDQKLQCTFSSEHYSGTFLGTMKNESQGSLQFIDEANNLKCVVQLGKVKNKPTDYFEGEIKRGKTTLSKLFGSYMGFADFDGVRYWDARVVKPFAMQILKSNLESDHTKRTDRIYMVQGDMDKAQSEKERLEQLQRKDAALRKAQRQND